MSSYRLCKTLKMQQFLCYVLIFGGAGIRYAPPKREADSAVEKSLENYNSFIIKFQENRYIIFFMFFVAEFFQGRLANIRCNERCSEN